MGATRIAQPTMFSNLYRLLLTPLKPKLSFASQMFPETQNQTSKFESYQNLFFYFTSRAFTVHST